MDDSASRPAPRFDDFFVRAAALPGFSADGAVTAEARAFLEQIRASADDAPIDADDILALAHDFWTWAGAKSSGEQITRVRPAAGAGGRALNFDVLEIAGPDMPFLVNSVMGELADQGWVALALFHPIVSVAGVGGQAVRQSYIQVHFARRAGQDAARLLAGVRDTLRDVRLTVEAYAPLKARMAQAAHALAVAKTNAPTEEVAESIAFLRWLGEGNFIFLGARDYQFVRDDGGQFAPDEPIVLPETGLGLLSDPERYVLRRADEPSLLTPEIRRFMQEPTPLVVSKSNLRSRVHRRVAADYIGVKRYDENGDTIGETRFVGLFTSDAYNESTREIPLLRRKVQRVLLATGASPGGHDFRVLQNILETYPRDELFQIGELELLQASVGMLHLADRPRTRLFVRRDRFNRFISALVFVPKDRFNSTLRERVGEALTAAYGGRVEAFYPTLGESPLARIHFLIQEIDKTRPESNIAALEAQIVAFARTWQDRFAAALAESSLPAETREALSQRFANAFTAAYRERFQPADALIDIEELGKIDGPGVRVRAYRLAGDGPEKLRCKVYARANPLALSETMPVLENMGLFVEFETGFRVSPEGAAEVFWVHDLSMRTADGAALDFAIVEDSFEAAFEAVWTGLAENDGFNRLILTLGVSWREAALIRALARYRTQTGLDPGQAVQEKALAVHPDITRQILGLFRVRFDTALPETIDARKDWATQIEQQIESGLAAVSSLDEDRVLRRITRLVSAIQRTNYYQPDAAGAPKTHMSFKIASPQLDDLPLPKPNREIWVWSPQVEGVHLRFGPIARGGLRWSDRREDFRTEVLALAKAQQVKNAIIVPVGAKGGFFPKLARGAPADVRENGVAAYKTFLRGLLDLTDDIRDGAVIHPANVICWDEDDPYLVVAADKGTATFSDIANGIAAEYGFWLGDAFASGGSAGYDHKAMAITARGAWEAVKRHFRELGKDIQTTPFDVIGVGDMSGDVFGNGMLLSKKIRLLAAFDHRDIFIDPTPTDLDAAWAERKRLFDKPRSSWQDYDKALISAGGGVFSRSAKSVPISPELRALIGLREEAMAPTELIAVLLAAPCDLLWFGGIGTFIKAAAESNADVGDKGNDLCRVDAEHIRARVIGEGANLGVTQAGRIAFARKGGRINADAVDNSAGVDTSDHEVNIKILLAEALREGALKPAAREPLLAEMADSVAKHVLKHNYDQTLALSLSEASAAADRDAHERFIVRLEAQGKLNRDVEGLPSAQGFTQLRETGQGLTRPELAKLIAYAKLDLSHTLAGGAAPDDLVFADILRGYFPPQLEQFAEPMRRHRLRREIIATTLADNVINIAGPTFIDRVREAAQIDAATAVLSFAAVSTIYAAEELIARVNALDNHAPATAQLALHADIAVGLRRATIAMSRRAARDSKPGVAALITRYQAPVLAQRGALGASLTEAEQNAFDGDVASRVRLGAPEDLARDVAALNQLAGSLDIADLAAARQWPAPAVARLYHAVGAHFLLDRLRAGAGAIALTQHWERLALRRLLAELNEDQRRLAEAVLAQSDAPPAQLSGDWPARMTADWAAAHGATAAPVLATITEMQASGAWTFAKIVLAAAALRTLGAR